MIIEDLLRLPAGPRSVPGPEMDPLREEDALLEADLVAIRADVMTSSVGVLFDLRNALHFQMGNAAVLIVRGVDHLEWDLQDYRPYPFVSHLVVGSVPLDDGPRLGVELGLAPNAGLDLRGREAEFVVGTIRGLDGAPPNFGDDTPSRIWEQMPRWDSVFVPRSASFATPPARRTPPPT